MRKLNFLALCVTISLLIAQNARGNDVVFTVVERIQFSVPGTWPVVASKSTPEKTVFAFQIPNKADEGTSDSTNLSIISSFLKDVQEKEAFEKKATSLGPNAQVKKLLKGWRCSTFTAKQGSTEYIDWDCYRVVADCGVFVRAAWPHLPKNPADYDKQMESVISTFLQNIKPSEK